jgi:hypothetical protein
MMTPYPIVADSRLTSGTADRRLDLVDELETQLADFRTTATRLLDALVAELTIA